MSFFAIFTNFVHAYHRYAQAFQGRNRNMHLFLVV